MKRKRNQRIKKCRGFSRKIRALIHLTSMLSLDICWYLSENFSIDDYDLHIHNHELFRSNDELHEEILRMVINSDIKVKSKPWISVRIEDGNVVRNKYYFTEIKDKNNNKLAIDIVDNELKLVSYDDRKIISKRIC